MHPLLSVTTDTVPRWARIGLAAVAGLMVGSFLNVVVYRVPRSISISRPRSFCPSCRRQLTWWENVPVVAWLALRGRCRSCGAPISPRYPLVEAGTAVGFGAVAAGLGGSLLVVPYCGLAATLGAILMIDAGELRSPLGLAASGTAVADVVLVGLTWWQGEWSVLLGAQAGLLVGASCFAFLRIRDPECAHASGIGRTALIPLGCWLGGLGPAPALWGGGAGIACYLAWAVSTRYPRPDSAGRTWDRRLSELLTTRSGRRPLLAAIAAAAAVSLLAAR
ncbi:MAG: prepilin peptidase [Actinomycetota bacterium]|nr:prepilin peptidase [Actinomycetota bacterium]